MLKILILPLRQEHFLGEYESKRRRQCSIYKFLVNSMQIRASAVYLMDSDEEESLVSLAWNGCCVLLAGPVLEGLLREISGYLALIYLNWMLFERKQSTF